MIHQLKHQEYCDALGTHDNEIESVTISNTMGSGRIHYPNTQNKLQNFQIGTHIIRENHKQHNSFKYYSNQLTKHWNKWLCYTATWAIITLGYNHSIPPIPMIPSFTSCLTMKPDINVGFVSSVLRLFPSMSRTLRSWRETHSLLILLVPNKSNAGTS